MKESTRYFDGLRGLAALVVVLSHFILTFYPAIYSQDETLRHTNIPLETYVESTPLNIFFNGNFAVCIFFVLSGYVLTYKFFKTKDTEYVIAGACKRYLRLMIPVFLIIFIAYVFMKLSIFNNIEVAKITLSYNWLATTYNFIPSFIEMSKQAIYGVFVFSDATYNTSLWTMQIEFFGSLLVFAMAALIGKLKKRWIIYGILIIYFLNTYFLAFILGMILSDLHISNHVIVKNTIGKYISVVCLFLGLFMGSYPTVSNEKFYGFMKISSLNSVMIYHTIGAVLLMIGIMNSSWLIRFFSSKPLSFLGKISFSMYLIHILVLCSFSGLIFTRFLPYLGYNYSVVVTFITSMTLIFVTSYYYYKYIDTGAVKLSGYIYKKIFSNESDKNKIENN